MTRAAREKLPPRRRNVTDTVPLKFRAPGDAPGRESVHIFHVTVGFYPDGRPAEIFVKATRDLDGVMAFMLEDSALLVSLLLQHGVSLATLRASVARGNDVAASIVAALLDAVAKVDPLPSAVLVSRIINGETDKGEVRS